MNQYVLSAVLGCPQNTGGREGSRAVSKTGQTRGRGGKQCWASGNRGEDGLLVLLKGQVHSNPFFRPHLGQCLLDPRLVALHHLQEGCYLFNCLSLEISSNICLGLSRQSTPHPFDLEWLHQGSDLHLAHLRAGRLCILQRLFQGIKTNDSSTDFYLHCCFSNCLICQHIQGWCGPSWRPPSSRCLMFR